MADLSGKVAVVTGAASGIGYALSEMWVTNGMQVVLADIEEDALEDAADRLDERGKVVAVPGAQFPPCQRLRSTPTAAATRSMWKRTLTRPTPPACSLN